MPKSNLFFFCQPTFQVCIFANVDSEVENVPGMPNHHCEQQTLLIFLPEEAENIQIEIITEFFRPR
jgi:hypothetical protein